MMVLVVVVAMVALVVMRSDTHHFLPGKEASPAANSLKTN